MIDHQPSLGDNNHCLTTVQQKAAKLIAKGPVSENQIDHCSNLQFADIKPNRQIHIARPITCCEIIHRLHQHTHGPEADKVEAVRGRTLARQLATTSQDSTGQVLVQVKATLTRAGKAALGSDNAVKKGIRRMRNRENMAPPNPANRLVLEIPEVYAVYEVQPGLFERFLQWDSGPGPNRILMLCAQHNIARLAACLELQGDGTFLLAPLPLFQQIYTIHGKVFGQLHPFIYALLPDKTAATYSRMLEQVKVLCPGLNPQSIMTDFELAAINSFNEVFPTSEVSGCFFHLAQNHFKKLTRLGLAPRYADDAEFAAQCKMISALAFVPPNDIVQAFEQLPEFLDRALDPMLDYIEQTYIGLPDRRGGRRNPMFPHRLWNMYDRVINHLARTNNAVEAWHRGIEVLLQMAHPTIWKLLDGLRTCQQQNDGRMEQLIAGHAPPQPHTKYRALNQRLETVVGTYAQRTLEDYLRGIAYNFNY